MLKNVVVITGASSGIGKEFAYQLDVLLDEGIEFWLVARNSSRLQEVSDSLKHKSRIFAIDITVDEQVAMFQTELKTHQINIKILINCAGYGLMGAFDKSLDRSGQLGMVRLNCEALTQITYCCIPYMSQGCHIVQLASSAAFLPQPKFAVYAATKSYVLSFSLALGEELKEKGIFVTSVCPGPVDTPFLEIAEKNGKTLSVKKYTMVTPERVVKRALSDMFKGKSMSVCSFPIRAFWVLTKLVPHRWILTCMRFLQ